MFELFQKGGLMMWPLLTASLVSMTVVIERTFFILKQKTSEQPELRKKILAYVETGNLRQAASIGQNSKDSVVRILSEALKHKTALSTTLLSLAADELKKYTRGISALDTIITLAPLLGLLGTVTGMISAFGFMGAQELDAPAAMTGGIAEALIATAFGLAIAIFSLIPFNWLNAYAEHVRHQMEQAGSMLEVLIQKSEAKKSLVQEQERESKEFYETSTRIQ